MIDWFKVITELQKNRLSMKQQSRSIGVSARTIANWRDGVEPKFSDGKRLIKLWCLSTTKNESELPVREDI